MGKGRDKRKRHEDVDAIKARAARQAAKANRGKSKDGGDDDEAGKTGGLDGEEDITDTIIRYQRQENRRKVVNEIDLPAAPSPPRANAVWLPFPGRENEFLLFGGEFWDGENTRSFNDIFVYNIKSNKWKQIQSPCTPCPRSSCQAWTHRHFLYVHGGEIVSRTQSQFMHFKDLWRFDLQTCVWEELTKGKGGPSARSGHRVVQHKRGAVLFGGFFDNGAQTTFFDDLWILSEVDAGGTWTEVLLPSYAEKPHPRSGHSLAVHNDEVIVFGGYYTFRQNRFSRSEATVLHDLWTMNLASNVPAWTKVKLAGIPPPIRSGMAFFTSNKKMYLFGGVVDLDGAGGKTVSTFHNDLFILNLDTKRFFPVMLKANKKKAKTTGGGAAAAAAAAAGAGGDLAAEINATVGKKIADENDNDEEEEEEEDVDVEDDKKSATTTQHQDTNNSDNMGVALELSAQTLSDGRVVPCPRMHGMICVQGHFLVLYGGVFELGKREVALCDVFSLNLNTLETYTAHVVQDVRAVPWNGDNEDGDGGSDAGSWEDGSTVAPELLDQLEDLDSDDDDDDDDDGEKMEGNARRQHQAQNGDDDDDGDDDAAPNLLAQKIAGGNNNTNNTTTANTNSANAVDSRTNIRGKIGKGHYLEQLKSQLSAGSYVPTPVANETCASFYDRTMGFWTDCVARDQFDCNNFEEANRKLRKRVEKAAEECARVRFVEATGLLRQIDELEAQLKAEQEALREALKQKNAAAAAAEQEDDGDDAGNAGEEAQEKK